MNNPIATFIHKITHDHTTQSKWITLCVYHVIFFLIILTNFHSNGRLMGWDGLYPELNVPLNITRGLSAGWQEYYGAGLVGGHGFAATLPHTLIIATLSQIVSQETVRIVFILLCYYLGGLGMLYASHRALSKIFHPTNISDNRYISLIATCYYLFNLGTIQTFYLPLEAFTVQFAMLPWLTYTTLLVFEKPTVRRLLGFTTVLLFASVQGFIPSLFLAYAASLACLSIGFLWTLRGTRAAWQTIVKIWTCVGITNLYWIAPVIYFTLTKSKDYVSAYNNIISTPEFIAKSIQYGTLSKVALLQGLYWSSNELGGPIMQPWISHFSSLLIPCIGYMFFALAVLGTLLGLTKKRNTIAFGFSLAALYIFGNLAIDTQPFASLIHGLQTLSPALAQAFRTTFTKFSVCMAFFYSISISIGIGYLWQILAKYKKIPITTLTGMAVFALFIYAMPVFRGNLIYDKLFVTLPPAYTQLTTYLNGLPDGKIADFPQDCNEGWYNYQWGHFGSGFLWYGVKHPIMARAFDVWSANNENYYWELSSALRLQQYEKVEQIFSKYHIRYILYDQNITHCRNQRALQSSLDYLSYLEQSPLYSQKLTLSDSHILPITLFERTNESSGYVGSEQNIPNIYSNTIYSDNDSAYSDVGTYFTDTSLSTTKQPSPQPFSKRGETAYEDIKLDSPIATISSDMLHSATCAATSGSTDAHWSYAQSNSSITRLMDTNTSSCINYLFQGINTSDSYILEITTRNITGGPLSVSITNKERPVGFDILLPQSQTLRAFRYVISGSFPSELEYLLTIKNTSNNQYTSINDIGEIHLYKNSEAQIDKQSTGIMQKILNSPIITATHPFPWYYRISVKAKSSKGMILTLAQSYDVGWQAYKISSKSQFQKLLPFLFGKRIQNHVKVNNWENGWEIPEGTEDYAIIFLPQLLEYVGFFILSFGIFILIKQSKTH